MRVIETRLELFLAMPPSCRTPELWALVESMSMPVVLFGDDDE
jgi:hypothetical protein